MNLMVLYNKAMGKLVRTFLSNTHIYKFISKIVCNHKFKISKNFSQARNCLELISASPAHQSLPKARSWPSNAPVDISVIVPCFNSARYLRPCLDSILDQDCTCSFEILAIDDGSTDETGAIIDDYAIRDSRIVPIHQTNRGFSGARNTGLSKILGKTVTFVDSDDMLEQNALSTLWINYSCSDSDIVVANYRTMSSDGKTIDPVRVPRKHGAPWGRLYSREVWRYLEFPEGLWFEDSVGFLCIDDAWKTKYINDPIYLYRKNHHGISSTCSQYKKSIDNYWVIEVLLRWRRSLDLPFDQSVYEKILYQFGTMAISRYRALSKKELNIVFLCQSGLLNSIPEFLDMKTLQTGVWRDLEKALKTGNFLLWRLSAEIAGNTSFLDSAENLAESKM